MTRLLIITILFAIVSSCTGHRPETKIKTDKQDSYIDSQTNLSVHLDSLKTRQISSKKGFLIKDSSRYSSLFLNGIRELNANYDSAYLIDGTLSIKSNSSAGDKVKTNLVSYTLPNVLPLDKVIRFKSARNDSSFTLMIKRINYTNLEYTLIINNHTIKSGQVILDADFFLESELEFNDDSTTYWTKHYSERNLCNVTLALEYMTASKIRLYISCPDKKLINIRTLPLFNRQ
jgi:hypothetical protein